MKTKLFVLALAFVAIGNIACESFGKKEGITETSIEQEDSTKVEATPEADSISIEADSIKNDSTSK